MCSGVEEQYLSVLDTLRTAPVKVGRNGETRSNWGTMIRHDMRDGFPLLTSKQVFYKGAFAELLWVLQGRTDMAYLHKHGVKYWDMNYEQSGRTDGTLGPIYGKQMRNFAGYDQLDMLFKGLIEEPTSRRHLLSLWNPADLEEAALPPCWYSVQFNIVDGKYIDLLWNQRSADWFLGVPFDLAMMALFLQLVGESLYYEPRYVVGSFADTHLYEVHQEQAGIQLAKRDALFQLPSLSSRAELYDTISEEVKYVEPNELQIVGYNHHPAIKAELV